MASVKRSVPLALSTLAVVMLAMLMAVQARADEVTFFDTTDTVTTGTTGSRITITACGFTTTAFFGGLAMEGCTATVSAPSGSRILGSAFVGLKRTDLLPIGEGDGTVSDLILFDLTSATITFLSDLSEGGIPLLCSDIIGGCPITEDGTVQFAGSIISVDNATGRNFTFDNINFQSDLNTPVPEPASLVLLGGGFLTVVDYIRRRRLA